MLNLYRPSAVVVHDGTCEECWEEGLRVQTCVPGDLNSMYLCGDCLAALPTDSDE